MSTQLQDPPRQATLPRLLTGIPAEGWLRLPEHLGIHGLPPALAGRRRASGAAFIEEVEHAGLRGRGGAAFPTAQKMRAVAAAAGRPVVVVNAAEGEPASMKDRTLLQTLPHLVLDGGLLAAEALAADEVIVCVCEAHGQTRAMERAIAERRQAGAAVRSRLHVVPYAYLAGQESALIAHLNGRPALPTFTPPKPFERGVDGRPTLVCNAETLAHLAMIARHGARWFRELGIASQPGSALVTLSGPVGYPGVYEIEHGSSLQALIDAAGGLTEQVRAILIGGYAGTWIDARMLPGLALCDDRLAAHGASLGAGVIALLSLEACPVAETARLMGWLADQGAGQCGPCVNGLHAIAHAIAQIADGAAPRGAGQSLMRLISLTHGRGACRHPDGAVRLAESAFEVFVEELSDHARHGRCEDCGRPGELPLPETRRATRVATRS